MPPGEGSGGMLVKRNETDLSYLYENLPEGSFMKEESREYKRIYAALKLIEYLYHKKLISKTVYKNILRDYREEIDLSDFTE